MCIHVAVGLVVYGVRFFIPILYIVNILHIIF